MLDFFPTMSMKPNETCDEYFCLQRQAEFKAELAARPKVSSSVTASNLRVFLGLLPRS